MRAFRRWLPVGLWSRTIAATGMARRCYRHMDQRNPLRPVLFAAAALASLLVMAAPWQGGATHPIRPGEIDADPQTMASITQGPDMITRAGSSQKKAREDLDLQNRAIAQTVTAKRWREIRNR